MRKRPERGLARLGAFVTGAALVVGLGVAVAPSAGAVTTPPWEAGAGKDHNEIGGLQFFDAAGDAITGGSLTSAPFAAYVEASKAPRAGDVKATLYAYTPVDGVPPGAWTGEQLTLSTPYPNAAAPAAIKTSKLPVVTGHASDETLAQFATDVPNADTSATDGYSGIYEVRLRTGAPQKAITPQYDSADLLFSNVTKDGEGNVTGGTWSILYSPGENGDATSTTLKLASTKSAAYATVKATATVKDLTTPATKPTGTVDFVVKGKTIAKATLKAGVATATLPGFTIGHHSVTAVLVGTASFKTSTSAAKVLTVTKATTKTKLTLTHSSIAKGKTDKITVTVTLPKALAHKATGHVVIKQGSKTIATLTLVKGKASKSIKFAKKGKYSIVASFTGSSELATSKSSTVKLTVS
jgi:Bacterial Ig-like domain (group 3)